MLLIHAKQIQKNYGTKTVLDFEQLRIHDGDKIGIVGANGSGKTTLLGILSREIQPDTGTVEGNWNVTYLHQFEQRENSRSGGENTKHWIQQKAGDSGQILFADEPTANLDADGQSWVRQKLEQASTVLLVSHDRQLLDDICTKIIAIKDGKLTEFTGNFTDYETAVSLEKEQHQLQHRQYQTEKARLIAAAQLREQKVARMKKRKKRNALKNPSQERLGGHKQAASYQRVEREANVLKARLERLQPVERQKEPPGLRIDFSLTAPPGNKHVITCGHLNFSYSDKQVLRDISFVVPNRSKIAVTGKNGAGKTTLLRLIYGGHACISTVPKLRLGYLYQNFENLDMEKSVLENALCTSVQDLSNVRSVLAGLLFFGDEIHKKAGLLSGGERMRLSLAKLLTSHSNALLLDEPTNYLDLPSVEAVQRMLQQYPGTVLLISHDEQFVQSVATQQLLLENGHAALLPIKQEEKTPPSPAEKTLLEIRLTQLVSLISSAPPDEKTRLEAEYQQVLQKLRRFSA